MGERIDPYFRRLYDADMRASALEREAQPDVEREDRVVRDGITREEEAYRRRVLRSEGVLEAPTGLRGAGLEQEAGDPMVTTNVVVLAGTVAADPVQRRMPSGQLVMEIRVSVPEDGKRLLPLPVSVWEGEVPDASWDTVLALSKGDQVLVSGKMQRRFYRSGAGARSLTEVVAQDIKWFVGTEPVVV